VGCVWCVSGVWCVFVWGVCVVCLCGVSVWCVVWVCDVWCLVCVWCLWCVRMTVLCKKEFSLAMILPFLPYSCKVFAWWSPWSTHVAKFCKSGLLCNTIITSVCICIYIYIYNMNCIDNTLGCLLQKSVHNSPPITSPQPPPLKCHDTNSARYLAKCRTCVNLNRQEALFLITQAMNIENVETHPMNPIVFIRRATGVLKQLRAADPLRWETPHKILVYSPWRKSTYLVPLQGYRSMARVSSVACLTNQLSTQRYTMRRRTGRRKRHLPLSVQQQNGLLLHPV